MAPIKVGDKLPDSILHYRNADGLQSLSIHAAAAGKKVVIFAVPGAFTPSCRIWDSRSLTPSRGQRARDVQGIGPTSTAQFSSR
ncbi:unnamed protein product [Calypogeia fissa]